MTGLRVGYRFIGFALVLTLFLSATPTGISSVASCCCNGAFGEADFMVAECCGWAWVVVIVGLNYHYQLDYCTTVDDFEAIYTCPDPCADESLHYLCYNTLSCDCEEGDI